MNVAYLRRSIAAVATVAALALGALPAISQAAPSATDRAAPSAKPCSAETRDGYARCMSRFRQENGGGGGGPAPLTNLPRPREEWGGIRGGADP